MTVNFRFNNGGTDVDFDDVFIRRDIFAQGNLWAWGYNLVGQLGDNTNQNSKSSPVQTVSGGTNWKQVSCGFFNTAAIKTDGSLWLWGNNIIGQLGNNARTDRSSPVQTVSGGTNWKQVSGNGDFRAAIKTDGTLWLWGYNYYGQLGNNATTSRSSPVQTVSGGSNWKQIDGSGFHIAAIKTDGTLWLWGINDYGVLGTNDQSARSSPVQTISGGTNWKQVSGGGSLTAAIKTDGTLWTWGRNSNGQLGDNTNQEFGGKSSPIQTVSGGTNWNLVSCGNNHTAAIKTDGTLWLWGQNSSGELGTNDRTDRSSPVQTVSGGTNWKSISAGSYFTAAIKTDGTLWLWGNNYYGQLGTNAQGNQSSPVQTVSGGTNWKQVSNIGYNTAAITDLDVY